MSSFGSQLRKRIDKLAKLTPEAEKQVMRAMKDATIAAIEAAGNATPPNGKAELAGTNTRTGQLSNHWALDSISKPYKYASAIRTELKNSMQYASYVNFGHRMDRHFVPGLRPNGGLLEFFDPSTLPDNEKGIMVGTRTKYVKGLYMTKKAEGKWRQVVRFEIEKRIKEAMK